MLVASTPRNSATEQQRQQQAYAAAQKRYTRALAGNLADRQSNYSAYPDKNADPCYYAENHDSADLCAQWRAAIAAEGSARWTEASFWIGLAGTMFSGIGLTALLISLRQTERSLGEARQANILAKDTAEKQLRAYVFLEKAWLEITPEEVTAKIFIKNFGQTPALKSSGWTHIWLAPFPLAEELPRPGALMKGVSVISPGNHLETTHRRGGPLNKFTEAEVLAGNAAIYVYGENIYTDIFGEAHRSTFTLFCSGKDQFERRRLAPYITSNEAD